MDDSASGNRSVFVTVVGWVFLVLTAYGAMIFAMQTVMFWSFFAAPEVEATLEQGRVDPEVPRWVLLLMENTQWIPTLFLVLSLGVMATCIGLLRRKNWARKVFIGILVASIAWSIGSLFVIPFVSPQDTWQQVSDADDQFQSLVVGVQVMAGILALVSNGLFVWIVWKLTRPSIREEFQPAPERPALPAA